MAFRPQPCCVTPACRAPRGEGFIQGLLCKVVWITEMLLSDQGKLSRLQPAPAAAGLRLPGDLAAHLSLPRLDLCPGLGRSCCLPSSHRF